MRSQSPIITYSTTKRKSLCSDSSLKHQNNNREDNRSTTPIIVLSSSSSTAANQSKLIQMTTGSGININNNSSSKSNNSTQDATTVQSNPTSSTSLTNSLGKSLAKPSSLCHNNNTSLSSNSNNDTTALSYNNNNNSCYNNNSSKLSTTKESSTTNPNSSKLQSLEQRKLELEKLLNEKNWLLQQIHKQEAQILNGSYENFNLFEMGKIGGSSGGVGVLSTSAPNSILRRKGSSSLKLPKINVHFNGKSARYTLSKSEYDLAQENKHNNQQQKQESFSSANSTIMTVKKRQGPPHKTNSFHDSTSVSALSLTKSPSFEYKGNGTDAGSGKNMKSNAICVQNHSFNNYDSSNENVSNIFEMTQCDKYYLSPTIQMYSDGNGFIKAGQNIKQCLSSSSSTQVHLTNGHHSLAHENNGNQQHLEQYESTDAVSLAASNAYEPNQLSNIWRGLPNNDRATWCDNSFIDLECDSVSVNQFHSLKPMSKKAIPPSGSSLQHSPESTSVGSFYPVGGGHASNYPNTLEKCDELSISSVNSETNKKPKSKQWMESSLDGPIIRPHILQTTPSATDTIALCPALSPTLSQIPLQYAYYNIANRQASSATLNSSIPNAKLAPAPVAAGSNAGEMLLVPMVHSRPPTRTLNLDSHPPQPLHHNKNYRDRAKLSSQSMSSGSYRTPKTKLDDENSHLSLSTSYLNVDPYHHRHFPQQQPQIYNLNHYYLEIPMQQQKPVQQQKSPKATPSSLSALQQQQQQPTQTKINSTTVQQQHQQQQQPSASLLKDEFDGNIRFATSAAPRPSRLCNLSQSLNKSSKADPQNTISISTVHQQMLSPVGSAKSPDIRIESPKNMTVVQQATFLPYKEVIKPFEMSDFYKYSTKFRQKEATAATLSKNVTQN